ncbi:MAG: FxsA family protein [Thermoleophilaceae bacterium]
MPLFKLLVVFIVVPLAELYVIYKIGDAIGILPTIALLALDSVAGSLLLKSQGRAVWRKFREALEQGRMPHREVLDGVLVIFGGAFLITPGFLTDIIGALCLLPFTRPFMRRLVARRLGVRLQDSLRATGPRPPRGYDVEGEATEYEATPPRAIER